MTPSTDPSPVLTAAARWRDDCLLGGGAVFSDEPLWNAENVQHLITVYTEALDTGEGDFFSKLKGQLAAAPPEASKLYAEMLWVTLLVPNSRAASIETKRHQIRRVYEWSGEELPESHPALGDPLETGLVRPGTAWFTLRWREMVYFVHILRDWYQLDRPARERLLSDPFTYTEWLGEREGGDRRMLPHLLSYMLFPDSFARSASRTHKREILQRLAKHLEVDVGEVDYNDRVSVDRGLLVVREALGDAYQPEVGGFYEPSIRAEWDDEFGESAGEDPAGAAELPDEVKGARVWLLSAGAGGRMWPDFEREGIATIGWDGIGDLRTYDSREEILEALRVELDADNPTISALACWQFVHAMEPGDRILARGANSIIFAEGVVTGDYRFDDSRDEHQHVRDVEWTRTDGWELPEGLSGPVKTLTDMTPYPDWLRGVYAARDDEALPGRYIDSGRPFTLDDALDGLFMSRSQFRAILDSLAQTRNLILQGPPGVGKTYVARRVARALMGERGDDRIEMVQFHQSYSYEDFVQGFRPVASGGFELRDGVFHRFCRRAADRPDEPFVFIIDEINRGNLSRIFGELLMLIEGDKRGREYAVPLTYAPADERFHVPRNVYLLGLMNTADRSLAIVDYALRRRFAFHTLEPAFGETAFEAWLVDHGVTSELVKKISERLGALNEQIRSDTRNLGPGYQVGHSYFVPSAQDEADETWYASVIETQVLPLVREYWFDSPDRVEAIRRELQ